MSGDETTPKSDPTDATPRASRRVAFFTCIAAESEPGVVPDLVARLDESLRELYEERAGILEYDSGMTRDHAECMALLCIYRDHPLEVLGVKVLMRGLEDCLLVTDPAIAEREITAGYGEGLVDTTMELFGGVVRLVAFTR